LESPYINTLLAFVAEDDRYNRELVQAKEEFQVFAGAILESDRSYDARINSFHNWYVLDRPLKKQGVTPLEYFLTYNANSLTPEDYDRYRELADNIHSIFEIQKFRKDSIRVRDLLSKKKYDIMGVENTGHLEPGTLFNSRIFTHSGRNYFSNYLLLHPAQVAKEVRGQARKARKAQKKDQDSKPFLFQLVLFQSRYDQYTRMAPENIYRFGA